jgi:uncharacterized protein DUF4167
MTTHRRNGTRPFAPRSNRSTSNSTSRRPDRGANAKARYEEYIALARAAVRTSDAVEVENYYQHAEHYYRLSKEQAE